MKEMIPRIDDFIEPVPELNKLQGGSQPQRKYTGWPDYSLHTDISDARAQLKPKEIKKKPKVKKKK